MQIELFPIYCDMCKLIFFKEVALVFSKIYFIVVSIYESDFSSFVIWRKKHINKTTLHTWQLPSCCNYAHIPLDDILIRESFDVSQRKRISTEKRDNKLWNYLSQTIFKLLASTRITIALCVHTKKRLTWTD